MPGLLRGRSPTEHTSYPAVSAIRLIGTEKGGDFGSVHSASEQVRRTFQNEAYAADKAGWRTHKMPA
jgi:hypothetical protein